MRWFEKKTVSEESDLPWWQKLSVDNSVRIAGSDNPDSQFQSQLSNRLATLGTESAPELRDMRTRIPVITAQEHQEERNIVQPNASEISAAELQKRSRILFSEEEYRLSTLEQSADFLISNPLAGESGSKNLQLDKSVEHNDAPAPAQRDLNGKNDSVISSENLIYSIPEAQSIQTLLYTFSENSASFGQQVSSFVDENITSRSDAPISADLESSALNEQEQASSIEVESFEPAVVEQEDRNTQNQETSVSTSHADLQMTTNPTQPGYTFSLDDDGIEELLQPLQAETPSWRIDLETDETEQEDVPFSELEKTVESEENLIQMANEKSKVIAFDEKLPTAPEVEQPQKEIPLAQESDPDVSFNRASVTPHVPMTRQYQIPFQLLRQQKGPVNHVDQKETQEIISRLEETLDQFGIEGRVIGIQRGPIITRYELKMAPGIKVNRILNLTDELAMALEALRVRIEAPIPGRSTVGIEIPNKIRAKVLLGDIVQNEDFLEHHAELPLPFGKDIAGNLIIEDLCRMPHLLIAGATGSGKSVAVNSFITSLILTRTPDQVRFILVDPKLVELSHYNDIPHLLHPVITDHQKAILALNWAVEEMERRYEDLAEARVRDIRSFNQKLENRRSKGKTQEAPMPYIVILIDELGDLMMVAGKEVEASIIRLAQKARAVGIHLILATQRPSVDVITALIKANCPARIALQVAQKTDSRTILDSNGAEQLLGQGDLLFKHPNKGQLIRVQAPLVLDEEVESIVNLAKKIGKPSYIILEDPKSQSGQLDAEDEDLFEEAWQIIVESGKASASYLQRRLRIGYNRAARLIEAFEARGMIGPQIGAKPREIMGR